MAERYDAFLSYARADAEAVRTLAENLHQLGVELGNRSGMASSYGQMAVLLVEQDSPEEAVPLTLRSLAIHLQLEAPAIKIDFHWLRRQRELLGEERFGEILRKYRVDETSAAAVLEMMEMAEPKE